MTTLKRILATTDLSAPARHAAERAALVSQETAAPLDLLHVANLAPLEKFRQLLLETADDPRQQLLDAAREKLCELAEMLRRRYGVAAGVNVAAGPVLVELTNAVDAMDPSLIVCGATGENLIRRLLLGATAERLLSRATRPVLVVKQAPRDHYRRLLVPVDFSASSIRAIRHAQAIAPQAEITLLHAFIVPFEGRFRYAGVHDDVIKHYRVVAREEATRTLRALSDEAGLSTARSLVLHGDAWLRIIEQEQEQDCDLIVMGKHGQSMLEELWLGSVTKHVLAESQSDVLVSV